MLTNLIKWYSMPRDPKNEVQYSEGIHVIHLLSLVRNKILKEDPMASDYLNLLDRFLANNLLETYISGHYNPSDWMTSYLLTPTMLCV